MVFHLLNLAHTIANKKFPCCAFTQKMINTSGGLVDRGHTVYSYGHELADIRCTEHITVVTEKEFIETYGDLGDHSKFYTCDAQQDYAYQLMHIRAVHEIRKRAEKDDFVLCFYGWGHQPIAEALSDLPVHIVEPAVGYPDTFSKIRVFESKSKMNFQQGIWHNNFEDYWSLPEDVREDTSFDENTMIHYTQPQWQDAVISYGADMNDFDFQVDKEDNLLFIGRLIANKGLEWAVRLADEFGKKLLVAGQGDFEEAVGFKKPKHVELLGPLGIEDRKYHLSRAMAVLAFSYYIEPLCFVPIEAMLSGTPPIVPNFGGPAETVIHKKTGFHARRYEHSVWALDNIDMIDPKVCRDWAESNYGIENVSEQYEAFFEDLLMRANGERDETPMWYLNPERKDLKLFEQHYPAGLASTPVEKQIVAKPPLAKPPLANSQPKAKA